MVLTGQQFLVLSTLALGLGGELSILARNTGLSSQELASIVRRMIKEGLVTSSTLQPSDFADEEDPDDIPTVAITRIIPTEKGMKLLDEFN